MNKRQLLGILVCLLPAFAGCTYTDIPQAHKGRMLDKASMFCPFGGDGLVGDVLPTGSYQTLCDEIRMVDCSTATKKEDLTSLTKDGVQFGLDVYVRYHADCSGTNVVTILDTMSPDREWTISSELMYVTYIRPMLGESVREVVSPYVANDVNNDRELILANVRENFDTRLAKLNPALVVVEEISLSNMDFPDAMDVANIDRATQAVLTDKAIAARALVTAELETAKMREELSRQEGRTEGAKIEEIGAALQRNPAYLQYLNTQQLPGIYETAGAQGNLVIAAPSPSVVVSPRGTSAVPAPAGQ